MAGKTSLIDEVAEILGMENAKAAILPEATDDRPKEGEDVALSWQEHSTYRTAIGKLLHISYHRPDVQHALQSMSKVLSCPTQGDMRRLKKLTRYLLGSRDVWQRLVPDPRAEPLKTPVDSDWADDRRDRKSCSGGAVRYYGALVLTWCRAQATIAQSSAEAELYALGTGAVESLGITQLLREWDIIVVPLLMTDSSSAKAVCSRRGPGRMKHIELRMLVIQQWLAEGRLRINKVSTHLNEADLLTKGMTEAKMIRFGRMLGLRGSRFDCSEYDNA